MNTTKEIQPGPEALKQAADIIRNANETWMTPSGDVTARQSREDYGAFFQEETEGWEATNQFQLLYADKLRDLADNEAVRLGILLSETETIYNSLYVPLKEQFWEAWAEINKLEKFWKENVKSKKRK